LATPASGVFYVATEQPRFVEQAIRSVESLRRWMPEVHVALFTDIPESRDDLRLLFDAVYELPVAEGVGTSWGSGLLGKVRAFSRSPYQASVYLDSDTRILKPRVKELFGALEACEIALAACEPGESRNQRNSGRPMFNTGVVAFRRTPKVQGLLAAWLELQEAHARAIRERRMNTFEYVRHLQGVDKLYQLVADQTALARYLAPDVNAFGVRCHTLERIWNWRRDDIDPALADEVVIHHAERFKVDPL
jgi:hypothetical protein